jgi:hypothetical protein
MEQKINYCLYYMDPKYVQCPSCLIDIEIIELNCRIFRCGIMKSTNQQINPHLNKEECDKLFEKCNYL